MFEFLPEIEEKRRKERSLTDLKELNPKTYSLIIFLIIFGGWNKICDFTSVILDGKSRFI